MHTAGLICLAVVVASVLFAVAATLIPDRPEPGGWLPPAPVAAQAIQDAPERYIGRAAVVDPFADIAAQVGPMPTYEQLAELYLIPEETS